MIRNGFKINEVMIVLVIIDKKINYKDELIDELKLKIKNLKSVI